MKDLLIEAIGKKADKDIYILGKGSTIDEFDLGALKDNIIINTNDTELLLPGEICVFHHGWVLDVLEQKGPQAKLYISDRSVVGADSSISAEYVANNPDNADFLLNRFYSSDIHIESSVLISALKIANLLSKEIGSNKNVYLLGFDFTVKTGFTDQMPIHMKESEKEYVEKTLKAQEHLLEMLLSEPDRLSINIKHVGARPYSSFTVDAFKKLTDTNRYSDIYNISSRNKEDSIVKVIAEITTNHFGDRERLKSMIIASKVAGADYIKLQKRDVESFYSQEKLASEYRSPFGNTFRDYRHGIELSHDDFLFVDDLCKKLGIGWFASVLDYPSYLFIKQFDPDMVKLPSTISEHTEFLEAVANDFKKDVVISTGYTHPDYEKFILDTFKNVRNVYLLQCTSAYPTANEATQVGVIRHYYNLSREYNNVIPGFSSHDIGSLCSMMAVAAGARMIEKHVKFGDVSWSHFDEVAVDLVNGDYAKVVDDIRTAERIVGSEIKEVHSTEHHKYWVNK
ncbi:N-acetylneuraminate synthase family protein [Cobetia sp. MC34]|uniref:N-acetylneuraminate synthase family protein n=1 Tax=Cobetia sp. MC34 TaxID=2785080 RepID=UPI001BC8F3D7|nr:N-acetylneuraminate synthase family protein [Cobetia sp. MC34]MBS4154775.1 N-acetylneuraminate synthase family protein [Cobetia sp. MC34]